MGKEIIGERAIDELWFSSSRMELREAVANKLPSLQGFAGN